MKDLDVAASKIDKYYIFCVVLQVLKEKGEITLLLTVY
jgi:hypothetical protein